MELLLARHGNTFGPEDKVVWAGLKEDLPLVEKGRAQAEVLAQYLVRSEIALAVIVSGTLRRTRDYGQIVSQEFGSDLNLREDDRLDEIDYGLWGGLSNVDIETRYGSEELQAWNEKSRWPQKANWPGSEQETLEKLFSFVRDLEQEFEEQTVLVVTSNGKLRYFLKLISGAFESAVREGTFKVKTGHLCKLRRANDNYEVCYWNEDPGLLKEE